MSEGVPVRGIVVSHGSLAEGLIDAVRQIAGTDGATLSALSNRGLSPAALERELRGLIGEGPAVVFTDLPSGSCSFAARRLWHEGLRVTIVSGVNLPQLLDFVLHRDLPLHELGPRLEEKGRASISLIPFDSERDARTAIPGR